MWGATVSTAVVLRGTVTSTAVDGYIYLGGQKSRGVQKKILGPSKSATSCWSSFTTWWIPMLPSTLSCAKAAEPSRLDRLVLSWLESVEEKKVSRKQLGILSFPPAHQTALTSTYRATEVEFRGAPVFLHTGLSSHWNKQITVKYLKHFAVLHFKRELKIQHHHCVSWLWVFQLFLSLPTNSALFICSDWLTLGSCGDFSLVANIQTMTGAMFLCKRAQAGTSSDGERLVWAGGTR